MSDRMAVLVILTALKTINDGDDDDDTDMCMLSLSLSLTVRVCLSLCMCVCLSVTLSLSYYTNKCVRAAPHVNLPGTLAFNFTHIRFRTEMVHLNRWKLSAA